MTIRIDRRSLVLGGGLGLGALLLPGGRAIAAELVGAKGFTHAVASGEPGPDSMLLWTRFAGSGTVRLDVEVARDPDFARVVTGGSVRTGAWRDWTAKITVDGLEPATDYWYRFIGPDGARSPVGRTRTLPVGAAPRFGLALFSCSNLGFGWFNAYAHAAARDDIDMWFHVGDYFYEYARGVYPSFKDALPERVLEPATEILDLADYRMRHACYRLDPDLQALHQMKPMIALWDDHESANNSWDGGAQNHDPETEGLWNTRRAAAMQAYSEWMPISEEPWKAYPIGTLATLYRTESRLIARTREPDLAAALRQADPAAALKAFRDGAWQDPSATMMGTTQESWLAHALKANARAGGWQIVGTGTNVGQMMSPLGAMDWLPADASAGLKAYVANGIAAARAGLPANLDNWGGYPAARARLLKAAQAADADLVMLSGDSHNAWAFDLAQDARPAGVEFGGHSVSSSGYESSLAADPRIVARGLVDANPELKWADTSHRGYVSLEITPERVSGDFLFLQTIRARSIRLAGTKRMTVERGRRVFAAA